MAEDTDDLDRIDGKSFVGWLIMVGAGTVGMAPWSTYRPISDIINGTTPINPERAMWHAVEPIVVCILASAVAVTLLVMLAKGGMRISAVLVLGIGLIMGLLTAFLVAGAAPDALAMGLVSGLLGGGAIVLIRHLVIRRA